MRLIDCHSHVNFNAYRDDAEAVISRAREQGIGMLAVGSQRTTSERAVTVAEKYDDVWAVIGLHPTHTFSHHVDEEEDSFQTREEVFDIDGYRTLAKSSKKVVAIGECGLDYYRLPDDADVAAIKLRQHAAFRSQLDLAHELGLPVMIHCRDAHDDVAEILEEYAAAGKILRGDVHCFTGTWAEAERYLKLNFFISFTGIITFPPRKEEVAKGETLQDVVRRVPLEKLLVETDAPYLSPIPFRGKRNEPAYVTHVAAKVAELKNLPVDEVERQVLRNAKTLFGI
jgi:TatD DNase family protein